MHIENFINAYDCILSDICGVLHNYVQPIGAAHKILKNTKKPVILLSNAGLLHHHVRKILKDRFDIKGFQDIITSGDFALYAQKQGLIPSLKGRKCFTLPQNIHQFAKVFSFKETFSIKDAEFILAIGAFPQHAFTAQNYAILHTAHRYNIPLICFNQDMWINKGGAKRLRGGILAQYYKALGGKVYLCGKPDPAFYQFAFNNAIPEKLLCIGDGLTTDGMGAHAIKRDFLLTASGNPALLWDHKGSFRKNIQELSARFCVPIPYAIWCIDHNVNVETFL